MNIKDLSIDEKIDLLRDLMKDLMDSPAIDESPYRFMAVISQSIPDPDSDEDELVDFDIFSTGNTMDLADLMNTAVESTLEGLEDPDDQALIIGAILHALQDPMGLEEE